MTTRRISIVQGTTTPFDIDLVDEDGEPYLIENLVDATAELLLRETATDDENVIEFTTADDPTRLWFDSRNPTLHIKFNGEDTLTVPIAFYVYRVRVTLADGTIFDAIQWSPVDINLGGVTSAPQPTFDNTVQLDHNWELPDALRYMGPNSTPIANAQIRVYYKSDYDAGDLTTPVGVTQTNSTGRWVNPILVLPGFDYVVHFLKPNEFGPDVATITA